MTETAIKLAIAVVAAVVCHIAIAYAIRRFGWEKENFRKEKIPAVAGLYIVAYGTIGAVLGRYLEFGSDPAARLYMIAILGFGLLGFLDDVFGSREVGGFRGHFNKLFIEKKLTTGAIKAIGGGLISVYLGHKTSGFRLPMWALDTAIIALAANVVNLMDLRPGRALFVFFVGLLAAAVLAMGWLSGPVVVMTVALAAAGVAHYDTRGRAMLGDVGSNVLGAVLGLTLALDTKVIAKLVAVAVFLVINIYSERRSISELIERHPVLKSIDSKLGVR